MNRLPTVAEAAFQRADTGRDSLDKSAWMRINVRDGESEAGLSDYEVRTWTGWYHHQTLSLIATGFLLKETRRGKKIYPGVDRAQVRILLDLLLQTRVRLQVSRLADALCQAKKRT